MNWYRASGFLRKNTNAAKDIGKDEKENGIDEVDGSDGDVERVGRLIHPRSENRSGDQVTNFNDNEANSLCDVVLLGQSYEHRLDDGVGKHRDNEVVGRCSELDVKETPLVESLGIGEEDVGWVSVHGNRATGNADDLGGTPTESEGHADKEENSQDDLSGRILLSELPKAKNDHLRESNQGQPEKNALEDGEPAIAEFKELVLGHPLLASEKLANALEHGHCEARDDNKNAEESETGHEQVCGLDLGLEGDSLDAIYDVCTIFGLDIGTLCESPSSIANRCSDTAGHHRCAALEKIDAG
ncbi:hypothetical protein HG530_013470 [Fusarium avenaceum]|nr:hypothetical protein HG530_013470 [Fusarium avenaceum]